MTQFHVWYTDESGERCFDTYAKNSLEALENAKNHLLLYGYGNECDFQVIEV